jgi:cell division protein FtsI/penicillin-binding protein 2
VKKLLKNRCFYVGVGLFIVMFVIIGRLYELQIVEGDTHREQAHHVIESTTKVSVDAPRGNIYDRNGLLLATTRQSYKVQMVNIDNPQEELQMSLTLHNVEDSSYDSYPLYGPDGIIINPLDSSKRRELYFSYDSEAGGSLEPNVLNGATAYFYIPENSTMLTTASAQTYWNEDMDAAHKKVGYTAVVKRFTTEFTQYDDGKLNMLKNTAPQELNGLGARYNYTQ